MKPDIACINHPDSEGFFQCRYCGRDFCERCSRRVGDGISFCESPECLKAYETEASGPNIPCPDCGHENPPFTSFCGACGKKVSKSANKGTDFAPFITRLGQKLVEIQLKLKQQKAPANLVLPRDKWSLNWAVLFWLFLFLFALSPILGFSLLNYQKGFLPDYLPTRLLSWGSDLLRIGLILYWTKRFLSSSWRESVDFLGYKSLNPRQLLVALLVLLPILMGEFLSLRGYQRGGALVLLDSDWPSRCVHYLLTAGFVEETIYRGFFFRFLRRGRSFLAAAAISAGFWALTHSAYILPIYDPQHDSLKSTAHLILEVFTEGLVSAFLFERGGNNIWGWMLVHVGYDCCFIFNKVGGDFYAYTSSKNEFESGYWLALVLTIPITLWLLPRKKAAKPEKSNQEKATRPFNGNEVSKKWKPVLGILILLSLVVLILFLCFAQKSSETAYDNEWKEFMDSHPRYADGYRQWAYHLWKLHETSEAEEKCWQALLIDPRSYKAWLLWGEILSFDCQYADAAKRFQKAVECAPRKAVTYLWWGCALEGVGKRDDAIKEYRTVLLLNPDEAYFTDFAERRIDKLRGGKRK